MPKDNGALWALGAAAALTGAAAVSRRSEGVRGSRNDRTLRFVVKPRVRMRCPPFESMQTEVEIPWDGDPATMPTRRQVLEAWRRVQNAGEDDRIEDIAWEVAFHQISEDPGEWTDFSIDDPATWHIEPVVEVRRGLGGRKHITAAGHPITMEQVQAYYSAIHDREGRRR